MKIKDLSIMAIMLALLIVSSKIVIPLGIISMTLQTFAVAIICLILKWKKAAIVIGTYIFMGLIGAPVFSSGFGGFAYIFKPSFGFIIGFFIEAFIVGSNVLNDKKWSVFPKAIIGLLVGDLIGLIYMYLIINYYNNATENNTVWYVISVGFTPFIIKDLISVVIAGLVSIRLTPALESFGVYNTKKINFDEKNNASKLQ